MKRIMAFLTLMVTVVALIVINVSLFASVTDDRIEIFTKKSFVFKTYLKDDGIYVRSEDGVVTLTGMVSGDFEKSLAGETAASLPGVVGVDNRLTINGEFPALSTDAWLIAKVKSTLWFHRGVNAAETEVSAKDGIVTLQGEASSVAQKNLAAEYAMDVEGVKQVNNEMTVFTAAMKSGRKMMEEQTDFMSEPIDDASVTALVKTMLMHHRSTSVLKTTVETKEGVIALGGKAANAAEKDLVTKLVSDVHGVRRVANTMFVR